MRRGLQILAVLAALWGGLLLAEMLLFAPARRLPLWTFPDPTPQDLRFDPELGFTAGPAPEPASRPFVLLVANRILGAQPGDELALAHRLSQHGIVHVAPSVVLEPFANTAQRALRWHAAVTDGWLVLALATEEVSADARETRAGFPVPRLHEQDEHVVVDGLTRQAAETPSLVDSLLAAVPTLRHLLAPLPRVPLPASQGLLPAALWPYRRGGVPDEEARYAHTALALRLLRERLSAHGSRLLVAWIPSVLEVEPERLGSFLAALELDTASIETQRAARRVEDICARLALPFADASLRIRTAASRQRPCFEAGEGLHPVLHARGRAHVFDAVAEELKRQLVR